MNFFDLTGWRQKTARKLFFLKTLSPPTSSSSLRVSCLLSSRLSSLPGDSQHQLWLMVLEEFVVSTETLNTSQHFVFMTTDLHWKPPGASANQRPDCHPVKVLGKIKQLVLKKMMLCVYICLHWNLTDIYFNPACFFFVFSKILSGHITTQETSGGGRSLWKTPARRYLDDILLVQSTYVEQD